MSKTKLVSILAALAVGVAAWLFWPQSEVPPAASGGVAPQASGGTVRAAGRGTVGYGWSVRPDTGQAIQEALGAAQGEPRAPADVTFVFYTVHHEPETIAAVLRASGGSRSVCGWSSDFGVIGPDGYHCSETGSLGLLRLRLPGLTVGVGSANLDESLTAARAAALALARAAEDANRCDEAPSIVVMAATYDGKEEEILKGLDAATGGRTPVLGGTAAGSSVRRDLKGTAIANGKVVRKGIALAAIYSREALGWAYRGGFSRTGRSGVITASDGRTIRQIDGRPALDVYDEWSGGRIGDAMRAGLDMNKFTGLYPLCRVVSSGKASRNLFIHAWPPPEGEKTRTLVTSATVNNGETVHFSEGTWNILLNRIGSLPQLAKEGKPGLQAAAGLLICCEAVLKNIPNEQREQISYLVNKELRGAPWIGAFTWGEQGNFPGLGNYHGNLLTGMLLLPDGDAEAK